MLFACLQPSRLLSQADAYNYYGEHGEPDCPGKKLGDTDNWEHLLVLVKANIVNSHKNWWLGDCNNGDNANGRELVGNEVPNNNI